MLLAARIALAPFGALRTCVFLKVKYLLLVICMLYISHSIIFIHEKVSNDCGKRCVKSKKSRWNEDIRRPRRWHGPETHFGWYSTSPTWLFIYDISYISNIAVKNTKMLKSVLKYGKTLKMWLFFCFFVVFLHNNRSNRYISVASMPQAAYQHKILIKADALRVSCAPRDTHTVFYQWSNKKLRLKNPKMMAAIWIYWRV